MGKTSRSSRAALGLLLLPLVALGAAVHGQGGPASLVHQPSVSAKTSAKLEPATRGRLIEGYGKLPLSFEANQGQTDSTVKFLARGSGYTLFLTPESAVLTLRKPGMPENHGTPLPHPRPVAKHPAASTSTLRMRLVGADLNAAVTGADELPGKTNYFLGNDPKKWRTNVPTYAKVKYEGVYPGVDLVYYGNQFQLEYDFVVAPGADPAAIKLNVVSAVSDLRPAMRTSPLHRLRIDRNGDLVVKIHGGEVRFRKPVIYEPATDHRHPRTAVNGRYRLAYRQVTFEVGSYDKTRPLVIDPALTYSTYMGGSSYDYGSGVAVDTSGNAYVTGTTESIDFPTTPGAFQGVCGTSCNDANAFVAKLNSTGSALLYSTYLGGSFQNQGQGITVDASGNAYVTSLTLSTDFPTTPGAFQTGYGGGGSDAFAAKLNPTGSALVYSTYLGGSSNDAASGITLDPSGEAYVAGTTCSGDFPTTPGAFQTSYGGGDCVGGIGDAFIAHLNATGSALVYSTYLGGSGDDEASALALDPAGNAYVAGSTCSTDFPITPGAFQTNYGGGQCGSGALGDAFVTKLDPSGSALIYSTYLGGNSNDYAFAIALDSSGNAHVTGLTYSPDFPTTLGAFQPVCGGCSSGYDDAFVTEFNASGSALAYSTYLGGSDFDDGRGIVVDTEGNAYVAGETWSEDFPATPGAFQTACGGDCKNYTSDAFIVELSPTGSPLLYSSYLGGSNYDGGLGIALDASNSAYVIGATWSTDFPVTPGAFQTMCGGGCGGGTNDVFVAKFVPGDQVWPLSLNFGSQEVGTPSPPQSATLTNGGQNALSIASIRVTANNGAFAQTNTCGSTLAVGASCTITVSWTPSAAGPMTGAITVTDSAANSPQAVSLTGTGVQPAVQLSPTSLTFSVQLVFTNSKPQNVTLTNTGTGTLTITSIAVTGQFTQTNTCGTSVAPGASCTINVTFRPTNKGTLTGTVTVTDNAPGSPQTVSLTGTGTYVELEPVSVNFGSQPVGTKSIPKKITLTNKGSVAVSISKISITGTDSGDFAETNTCGGSVASGASCFISVTFTPSAKGKRTASVAASDNGGGSPQIVVLTGTGT